MPRVNPGKRYAQAAFELALEKRQLENWQADLSRAAGIASDIELMSLLENPKLPFDTKKGLLEKRLGKVIPLVLNLTCLLMSRGRLKIVGDISQQYSQLLDSHHAIEHAEVATALPLDDKDKVRLANRLGEIVGQKIIIDAQTDPSIIGGFRARIGDTLIDGSIHNTLELLRKSLTGTGR
jgi:F-type H+-transporting ATPase subunit delta